MTAFPTGPSTPASSPGGVPGPLASPRWAYPAGAGAAPHVARHDGAPVAALGPSVRPSGMPGIGAAVLAGLLGILALVAIGVVGMSVGPEVVPAAGLLAAVPLAVVMAAVLWVDRWEREPWSAIAVAFGWGASVSVLVALVLNTGAMAVMVALGSSTSVAEAWGATLVAPVVEEAIKGLGVLLVFLVWRRSFDGPVDGLVYAGSVAAGFAFVENILYFGGVLAEAADAGGGTAGVATVFVLRGVMSPFAHLLFTACTGVALGVAARSRSRGAWVLAFPLGLLLATVLHALWNGSAILNFGDGAGASFVTVYVLVQVPLFLGAVGLAFFLRRREAAVVRIRLAEYAAAGWFAPVEVQMLSSLGERARARRWAADRGGRRAGAAMRAFQAAATRLAYHRHRVLRERGDSRAPSDEAALLTQVTRARSDLVGALASGAGRGR